MHQFYREQLLVNYLSGSISSVELDELNAWLDTQENGPILKSFLHIDFVTRYSMSQYDTEKAKARLLSRIRKDKSTYRRFQLRKVIKYAAIGLLFLALGYTYRYLGDSSENFEVLPENAITLEFSDGTLKVISEDASTSILDCEGKRIGLQKGNQLMYHRTMAEGKIAFNTLRIPHGKRFIVILSDGTKAHLNAGTSLRYPVKFVRDQNRQVYLKGEGYFDVASDKAHPFIIHTDDRLNIEVLGTKFNISAYTEDKDVRTVLVEGSVELVHKDASRLATTRQRMQPGYRATWQKDGGKMNLDKVDTGLYTGWMDGKIAFKHAPFEEICKTLERNYNVSIRNTYPELDKVRFTAAFDTETIAQVFEAFSKNHPMRYKIGDEEILIEKP